MPISEQIYKFTVSEQDSGLRADIVLFRLLPNHSRAQIKKLIESQHVLLNDRGLKASSRLTVGQELSVKIPSPEKIEASPEDIPISVIYEDQSIIVVNKPANLVVHPGAGVNRGTLVNAILFRCRDLGSIGGKIRPGIVHRLDKDTSGVMVIAKNDASHNSLVEQFKAREVKKSYLALVYGNLKVKSGCFESEIGRHPVKRIKMSSKSRSGRKAITKWIVERRFGIATLVNVEPMTGRTHQIRVHFSENGHPIIGNLVTNISSDLVSGIPTIRIGERIIYGVSQSYSESKKGEISAIKGSSGFIEISVNQGRASDYFEIKNLKIEILIGEKSKLPK